MIFYVLLIVLMSLATVEIRSNDVTGHKIFKIYDTGPLARSLYVQLIKSGYKAVLIDPKTGLVEYGIMQRINKDIGISNLNYIDEIANLKSKLAHEIAKKIIQSGNDSTLIMDLVRIIRGDSPKKLFNVLSMNTIDASTAYLALRELEITENSDPDIFILQNMAINLRNSYAKMEHWITNLINYDEDKDKLSDELEKFLESRTMVIGKPPKYLYLKLPDGEEVPIKIESGTQEVIKFNDTDLVRINVAAADGELDLAISVFRRMGGIIISVYPSIKAFIGYLPINKITQLASRPEIGFVELAHSNIMLYMRWSVAAMRVGTSWYKLIKPSELPYYSHTPWGMGYTGDPETAVAIVDTGIDDSHFLIGSYGELNWTKKIIHWEDFTPDEDAMPEDKNGHGTHCASIAVGINTTRDYVEWETIYRTTDYYFTSDKSYTIQINETGWYAIIGFDYVVQSAGLTSPTADISITVYDPNNNQLNTSIQLYNGSIEDRAYESERAVFYASTPGTYTIEVQNNNEAGFLGSLQYQILILTLDRQYPYGGFGSIPGAHTGVAPDAKLIAIRIMSGDSGSSNDLYQPIQWQIDNGQTYHEVVSSNSWGIIAGSSDYYPTTDATLDSLFNQLVLSGIVSVVAAGNYGYNPPGSGLASPAQADLVITVAAVNDFLNISSYSSAGDPTTGNTTKPDVAAVGGAGYFFGEYVDPEDSNADGSSGAVAAADSNDADNSPKNGENQGIIGAETSTLDNFWDIQGTSMATPHVAGIAALVIDAMGGWDSWQYSPSYSLKVKMIILMTAVKWRGVEDEESYPLPYNPRVYPKDNITGYGVVQADAAVMAVTNTLAPGNIYTYSLGSSSTNLADQVIAPKIWAGKIYLEAGTTYSFDLDVPITGDFDLYLYSGNPDEYGQPVVVAKSQNGYGQDESITYTPSQSGWYYVVVKWYDPRYEGRRLWENYGEFKLTIKELTPPSVTIIQPTNNSYINSLSFQFSLNASDNFELSRYEIYVGTTLIDTISAGGTTSDTQSYIISVQSDGSYQIKVIAYDTSNNTDESFVNVVVDTTPPSVSINSPNDGDYVSGVVTIEFTVSDANFKNATLYIDGTAVQTWTTTGTHTYAWNTTTYVEGQHTITVKAYDLAGNNAEENVYVTIDNTAPSVSITCPAEGSVIGGIVTIEFTADDAHLKNVTLYVNGTAVQTWTTAGNITYSWDTTSYSDGTYIITVKAYDQAENLAEDSIIVTIDNTVPSISIMSPTNNSSVGRVITIEFTVDDTNIDYSELIIDGTVIQTYSSTGIFTYSWDTTTYLDGQHIITVRAYDKAGNLSEKKVIVIVDNTSPTIEITSPVDNYNTSETSIIVEWSASDATTGVNKIEIYRNGTLVATLTGSATSITVDLLEDGVYNITVVAIDSAGNINKDSVIVRKDTIAPSVKIVSPANGTYINETSVSVSWSALDSGSGVKEYNVYIDGSLIATLSASETSYTVSLSEGIHIIRVEALDYAGNSGYYEITITIDVTPPSVLISTPSNGSIIYTNIGDVNIAWNANDSLSGVSEIVIILDCSEVVRLPSDYNNYTLTLSDGTHKIEVVVYDTAGNKGLSNVIFDVVVDTTAPTTYFTSPENNSWFAQSTIEVSFIASDDVALDKVELYDNDILIETFLSDSIPSSYILNLTEGCHVLRLVAYDKAGNNASDELYITVDLIDPYVRITYPENASYVGPSFTLTWNASDNLALAKIEVYLNDSLVATYLPSISQHKFENLTVGTYTVTVIVYDKAGRTSYDEATFFVTEFYVIITSPNDGSYFNTYEVTIVWEYSGNVVKFEIYLNGTLKDSLPANITSYTLTGLSEFNYIVKVVAYDADNNTASYEVKFTIDLTAPSVEIISPTDGGVLNASNFLVTWSGSDNSGISEYRLYLNNTLIYVGTDTSYNITVETEGSYLIKVEAYDVASNKASAEVYITVETVLEVKIVSPEGGAILGTDNVKILIHVNSTDIVTLTTVKVDGRIVYSADHLVTSIIIELNTGKYTITVELENRIGRRAEASITITVDVESPTITIISPADGSYTTKTEARIEWSAKDFTGIEKYEVYVDGELVKITTGTSCYIEDLSEGVHNITIKAIDIVGNSAKASVSLSVDLTPPSVRISSPSNFSYVNSREITVILEAFDNFEISRIEIYVNGELRVVTDKTNIKVALGEDEGGYILLAKVFDPAGNEGKSLVIAILDKTPPIIRIIHPANNTITDKDRIEVSWDGRDNSGINHYEVKVNDDDWENIGLMTKYTVTLKNGTNMIKIKAVDYADNEAIVTLIVEYSIRSSEGPISPVSETMIVTTVIIISLSALGIVLLLIRRRPTRRRRQR